MMWKFVLLSGLSLPLSFAAQDATAELGSLREVQVDAAAREQMLSRVLFDYRVDGDAEKVLERLGQMRLALGLVPVRLLDAGWLTRSTHAHAQLLIDLGRFDEARALIASPLPSTADYEQAGVKGAPAANVHQAKEIAAAWHESTAARGLLERLDEQGRASELPGYLRGGYEPWAIDWIRREIGFPDAQLIDAARNVQTAREVSTGMLGRMSASLAVIALRDVADPSNDALRAFSILAEADSALAAEVAWVGLPHAGPAWRRVVVDALPLDRESSWIGLEPGTFVSSKRLECRVPRWIDILGVLLLERPTDPDLRDQFRAVASKGALSGKLHDAVQQLVGTRPMVDLKGILRDLDNCGWRYPTPCEPGIDNPDPEVRAECLARLSKSRRFDALLAAEKRGVPGARVALVNACYPSGAGWLDNPEIVERVKESLRRPVEETLGTMLEMVENSDFITTESWIFELGLDSESEEIRSHALEKTMQHATFLQEAYFVAAASRRPDVRRGFVRMFPGGLRSTTGLEDRLRSAVAELLRDPDPDLRRALASKLWTEYFRSSGNPTCLRRSDVARIFLEHARATAEVFPPSEGTYDDWRRVVQSNGFETAAFELVLELAFISRDPLAAGSLLRSSQLHELPSMPVEQVVEILPLLSFKEFSERLRKLDWSTAVEIGRSLAARRDVHPYLRLWAFSLVPIVAGEASEEQLLSLLEDPRWAEGTLSIEQSLLGQLPLVEKGGNEILSRLLSNERIAKPIRQAAIVWFEPRRENAWSVAKRLLELAEQNGERNERWFQQFLAELAEMERHPECNAALVSLLHERHPEVVAGAARVVRSQRASVSVDVLGEALTRSYPPSDSIYNADGLRSHWSELADALVATGDERALGYLRAGLLFAGDSSARAALEGAIRRLETYLESETAANRLPSRSEAESQLLDLLQSKNPLIRCQAIRGLGTLGAVEAIPVLIPLLESDSPEVREAVLDTLDRLSEAKVGARESGGSDE